MTNDLKDLVVLVAVLLAWALLVLPDYATSLLLRRTLTTPAREPALRHIARQGFESKYLVWGLILGATSGGLSSPELKLRYLFLAGFAGFLLLGLVAMVLATHLKVAADPGGESFRFLGVGALGVLVFFLAALSVKLFLLQSSPFETKWITPALTAIATLVSTAAGLLSIFRSIRKP